MTLHRSLYDDPAHWRARAEETRAIANVMHKTETTAIMLRIAKDYDRLAELTEIRTQAIAKKRQSEDRAEERVKASGRRQL